MKNKKKKTVKNIINKLNKINIKYGILRNYKNFPNIASDLDIITQADSAKIKQILKSISKKIKWDYLFYDNSKSYFLSEITKIETFYFIDFKKFDFLQVDFFRSLSILGTPYLNLHQTEMVKINKSKIYILPKNITNMYHAFQIGKLFKGVETPKVKKYKKNFLSQKKNFYKKKIYFENYIIKRLRETVQKKNYSKFKNIILIYKILIFFKYYINNFSKIYLAFYRIIELYLIYFANPTGFKIKINYKDKQDLLNKEKYLNLLKKNKIINDWKYDFKTSFFKKMFYLERRNIIVEKNKSKFYVSIKNNLIKSFLRKYKKL